MPTFDATQYGPFFAQLLECDRLRSLGEGTPVESCRNSLDSLTVQSAFAHASVVDDEMARCCISGIWLLYDFLDESHTISQSITTTSGSYWHGIMHRREGDFSNAKYWFRKVGEHPVFEQLAEITGSGEWDSFAFVDACQAAVRNAVDVESCQTLQQREWEILFDHCYAAATR